MKKLSNANLRWWCIALIIAASPCFGQLTQVKLPAYTWLMPTEMTVFQNTLYMVVKTVNWDEGGFRLQLCKYDGASFTTIDNPVGWNPGWETALQVYQGNLYLIMVTDEDDPTIPPPPELYRFDGTTFTHIPFPPSYTHVPSTLHHGDMKVYDNKLYLDAATSELAPVSAWVTYDGTGFSLIEFPPGMTDTGKSGMKVYHDKLFCMMHAAGGPAQLVSYDGATFQTHGLTDLMETKAGVYNDKLIVTQNIGGVNYLVEMDETTTRPLANPSGVVAISGGKEVYNGQLFFRMDDTSAGDVLMAYDGYRFTQIAAIGGIRDDFEVWNGKLYMNADNYIYTDSYLYIYEQRKLPDYYYFNYLDLELFTIKPGWCWSEIVVDWQINPICPVPPICLDPGSTLQVSLDLNGKEVWNTIGKESFTLKVPECNRDYKVSLSVVTPGGPQNLITISPSLVDRGVENIRLGLKPQESTATLMISTQENKSEPVTISFLNEKGKAVWQEKLVAPIEKQLVIKSKEPGTKFLIEPGGATLESAGITAATYYPNPFDGKITVELQTKGNKVPVQVTIDDPNGKRVVDVAVTAPVKQILEVKDKKPGFYILTFYAGGASRQGMIELK